MASSSPSAGRRLAALGRHLIRRRHLQQAAATRITRVITLEELARHRSASSCWVALSGHVYDFTEFVQSGQHPGGARSLLRHAGTDASEAFAELHTQSIFAAFAPRCRIGVLETTRWTPAPPPSADEPTTTQSSTAPRTLWPGVRPSSRGWAGLPGSLGDVSPLLTCLPSPFPHDRFTATGCESFRFHWTIADRLLRLGDDDAHDRRDQQAAQPASQQRQQMHMHSQKSNLGVLNAERDWLHVGAPEVYAAEMVLKERLYLEHSEKVYVTTTGDDGDDGATLTAEAEVLEEVLQWLARRYPKRFQLRYVPASASEVEAVTTLTPGYRRCYALAEWTTRPLVLVGLLVQEDFYLLDERAATAGEVRLAGDGEGFAHNLAAGQRYDFEDHVEDHPSGKQHVMVAACSCFSFDAVPRHGKPMSAIHHPNVPGWRLHLQRGMNRLFSSLTPERAWFRHTQDLGFAPRPRIPASFQPRPVEAFTGPFAELVFGASGSSARALHGLSRGAAEAKSALWESMARGGARFMREQVLFSTEFQTLRRTPRSNCVLFTVRRYIDPLANLERWPAAAVALAAAVRRKYKGSLARSGLGQRVAAQAVLGYLDDIAANAGLKPGLRGVVPEPWERTAMVDGTNAAAVDEAARNSI